MSIKGRLTIGVLIQVLLLALLAGIDHHFSQRLDRTEHLYQQAFEAQIAVQQVLRGAGEVLLTEGSSSSRAQTSKAIGAVEDHLGAMLKLAPDIDTELAQTLTDKVRKPWESVRQIVQSMLAFKKISVEHTEGLVLFGKLTDVGESLSRNMRETVDQSLAAGVRGRATARTAVATGTVLLALALLVTSVLLHRAIVRPLNKMVAVTEAVASGDVQAEVDSANESAEMARALRAVEHMQGSLAHLVHHVRQSTQSVVNASGTLEQDNRDLEQRTERQATAVEETASLLGGLSERVQQNADNARQANQLAGKASAIAAQGGKVVDEVVDTMRGINEASNKIADIIGVIDAIAFQTNILALNAAVEAARAGEQGRGFAVVASEVRTLAGRSADAAKEIRLLITNSVERVERGTGLADQAGGTMNEVVAAVQRVADIMGEITVATDEQSTGAAQVRQAIEHIRDITHQNVALVAHVASATTDMRTGARALDEAVSVFRIKSAAGLPAPA